ncbi:hypothetical protein Taro_051008 [Colocasia esculenta]|uniref:CCHC-type domain-containing protein n=1 Tax=Colocasia esculenta TaxID=4460 RepID=A0A843XFP0_COLES|nr:hypothetical protein [Colocasia esculenta]
MVFLRAQNYDVWRIVEKGTIEVIGDEDQWTKEQIRRVTLNYSATNKLQCANFPKEYSKISMCKSAKEMWDKLELLYEGTSQVRETKANMLVSDYELFIMKSDETISEMFARFMVIINGLRALSKEYSNEELVRKILRSLSPAWHTKATVIEDSKDLSKIALDELIGSLMTYELNLKRSKEHMLKSKPITLKASSSSKGKSKEISESENSESDNDNLALITRQFRAFLKSNKKNFGNKQNVMSSKKKHFSHVDHKKTNEIPVCYRCNKSRHMKDECPEAKKDRYKNHKKELHKKKNKAMVTTWSDEDQSSDSNKESSSSEGNKICFMAGSSEEHVDMSFELFTIEDWQEAYGLHNLVTVVSTQSTCVSTQSASSVDRVCLCVDTHCPSQNLF